MGRDVTARDLIQSVEETHRLISQLPEKAFENQGDFFDDGMVGIELARLDEAPIAKRYTGEKLEQRVAVRDAVCRMLAEGMGILLIAKSLRQQGIEIGERSIMALRDRRPDLVAIEKKQLSTQLGRISKLMADSIETRLINGTMKPGSIDLAVMVDKKMALDGDASMVIEHRHTVGASADGFLARLEQMKRAKATTLPIDSESTVELPKTQ